MTSERCSGLRRVLACAALAASCAAAPARAVTIDFDSIAAGTAVTTIAGVTFGSNIAGYGLTVSDIFDTSSGANYLGVDDGGSNAFLPLDEITFAFSSAIVSLSLKVIATQNAPSAAFVLDGGAAGSDASGSPTSTLPDTGEVYLLSISSLTPFSSASLRGDLLDVYSFNLDDIVFDLARGQAVPEPGTLLLAVLGAALFGLVRRRRPARV